MADVSGTTSNSFAYEGEYQLPTAGRVLWSVTFRKDGDFAGIRHGVVRGLQDADAAGLDEAVRRDIESTWTMSR